LRSVQQATPVWLKRLLEECDKNCAEAFDQEPAWVLATFRLDANQRIEY